MYPIKIVPPITKMDAREAVDILQTLIDLRIDFKTYLEKLDVEGVRKINEDCELLKRQLTDYLLATDPRRGVYVKGPHD